MRLSADDERWIWNGAVDVERVGRARRPLRYPAAARADFDVGRLLDRATMAAGVRVGLVTDARALRFRFDHVPYRDQPGTVPSARFDVTVDGRLWRTVDVPDDAHEIAVDGWSPGVHRVELWMPTHVRVVFRGAYLELGDARIETCRDDRPRWITHGSSITHCGRADSPTATWPALVAAARGWNHTNLGYGGECKLEQHAARMIRDLPADVISLKLGINAMTDYSVRGYRFAVLGMVRTIRDGHPATPLVLMSPIFSPGREDASSDGASYTPLTAMRREMATLVQRLRREGDRNLYYLDGLRIFGPSAVARLPDGLHPDAEGIRLMARSILRAFARWPLPRGEIRIYTEARGCL